MEENKNEFLETIRKSDRLAKEDAENYAQICNKFAKFIEENNCKQQDEDDE